MANYTFENYFINSKLQFKGCKTPKRNPNHISFKKARTEWIAGRIYTQHGISSEYWYGSDTNGDYIIRKSDHWGNVGSCRWTIEKDFQNKQGFIRVGKAYLSKKSNNNVAQKKHCLSN